MSITALVGLSLVFAFTFVRSARAGSGGEAQTDGQPSGGPPGAAQSGTSATAAEMDKPPTYVGNEACKACHAKQTQEFAETVMGKVLMLHAPGGGNRLGCESCHGPGSKHMASGGKGLGGLISFRIGSGEPVTAQNDKCLQCHESGARAFWRGSAHAFRGVACATCHTVMRKVSPRYQTAAARSGSFVVTRPEAEVCLQCHTREQINLPSHMPVREGLRPCTDCHNPHGAPYPKMLKKAAANQILATKPAARAPRGAMQVRVFRHYAYDEKNSVTKIRMLMKVGGESGIHWHKNIANRVSFVATDKNSQNIPWVRAKHERGRTTEYVARGSSLGPGQIAAMPKHTMECITCHGRPGFKFRPPDRAVDRALATGGLDPSLPFIKREVVKALTQPYPSAEKAAEGIQNAVELFYRTNYLKLYLEKRSQVRQAILTAQSIYTDDIFPAVKSDWRPHPDNAGHLHYWGCVRCHDGQHASADGRVIPSGCDTCHTECLRC